MSHCLLVPVAGETGWEGGSRVEIPKVSKPSLGKVADVAQRVGAGCPETPKRWRRGPGVRGRGEDLQRTQAHFPVSLWEIMGLVCSLECGLYSLEQR